MTTRADVERLRSATGRLVELIRADLTRLFRSLDMSRPEWARDALLEAVPALVREYGEMAAVVAAEWYEEIRAAQVAGSYTARLGDVIPDVAPISSVRYAARHLFTEEPESALKVLSGAVQRHVLYSSRDTVARNVRLDPARPRFARIPTGPTTCAWCDMMASRGFVYYTEAAAGDKGGDRPGFGDDFHDDCDCQVVASFDREQHHLEGYDPDAMFARYKAARKESGSGDPNEIAASLRRLYPYQYTDGVLPKQ